MCTVLANPTNMLGALHRVLEMSNVYTVHVYGSRRHIKRLNRCQRCLEL